jgi:hypothetical protein
MHAFPVFVIFRQRESSVERKTGRATIRLDTLALGLDTLMIRDVAFTIGAEAFAVDSKGGNGGNRSYQEKPYQPADGDFAVASTKAHHPNRD